MMDELEDVRKAIPMYIDENLTIKWFCQIPLL